MKPTFLGTTIERIPNVPLAQQVREAISEAIMSRTFDTRLPSMLF
jgi:hypothetical protein